MSGEEKGRGKPKEQSKNSVNAKEDKGRVLPENREQSENLANVNEDKKIVKEDKEIVNEDKEIVNEDKEIVNEDKGIVWKKLEKEAADAVARAAAAVSGEILENISFRWFFEPVLRSCGRPSACWEDNSNHCQSFRSRFRWEQWTCHHGLQRFHPTQNFDENWLL